MIGTHTGPDAVDRESEHLRTAKEKRAFRQGWIGHIAATQTQKHEQRRYEVARAVMAALSQEAMNQDEPWPRTAADAVKAADALLVELERLK